ncbi:MAG: hypothetical protein PHH77_12070 [Victivallaceae bacterium]|nr:hypothetical protein [Victivallaceae bacterium]
MRKATKVSILSWVEKAKNTAALKGAEIIAMEPHHNKLLAVTNNSLTPYVCWRLDRDGEFALGEYHSDFNAALETYDKRPHWDWAGAAGSVKG